MESTGPLGDDLDRLFAQQLRSHAVQRDRRPAAAIRQRGTLPGRLSPTRFGLSLWSSRAATDIACGQHVSWALAEGPPASAWRLPEASGVGPELALLAPLSPVSLAVGAHGHAYVGDAWRGAFRLTAADESPRLVESLPGVDPPVGPLRLLATSSGEVWGLDGLGVLRRVTERGLDACPFDVGGRVYALAHDGAQLRLLVRDHTGERYLLRTPGLDEADIDLGRVSAELDRLPALCAGPGGVVAMGVAANPLLVACGSKRSGVLPDLEGAHSAAWLSHSDAVVVAFAVRVARRDVIWLLEGDRDAVVIDLGEPIEFDDGTLIPAPGIVRAMAVMGPAQTLCIATHAGIVALCIDGGDT